jgi:hypothetical protein
LTYGWRLEITPPARRDLRRLDPPVWSQDKGLATAGLDVYTTGDLLDALRDSGHIE